MRGLCFILFWICDAVLGESDSTFESCIWVEIEFEDELCCGGWNPILFHQLANSAQPTREILSLQAKRDDLLSLDRWKNQSWLAAFSGQVNGILGLGGRSQGAAFLVYRVHEQLSLGSDHFVRGDP